MSAEEAVNQGIQDLATVVEEWGDKTGLERSYHGIQVEYLKLIADHEALETLNAELLEALREVLRVFVWERSVEEAAYDRARKAIAKAEGR